MAQFFFFLFTIQSCFGPCWLSLYAQKILFSSFVFHGRKKVIWVWNDTKVSKWTTFLCELFLFVQKKRHTSAPRMRSKMSSSGTDLICLKFHKPCLLFQHQIQCLPHCGEFSLTWTAGSICYNDKSQESMAFYLSWSTKRFLCRYDEK